MGTSKPGLLQHVFCFFPRAEDHHAHAFFFYAEYSPDFLMAHLLNVCQPEYGAFLRAQPVKNRCHIQRQIKFLVDVLGEVAHLPQSPFALQLAPSISQQIGCSPIEIAFARKVVHWRRVQHADVCLLQNLIGSHDTERFLTLSNGDDDKLKLALLMQMTYPGAPMVYYGDEIGMEGGKDPDCRKTMIWDKTKWNEGLLNWYKRLIKIRNTNPVFRRGTFSTFLADNSRKIFWFTRELEGTKAVVILNNEPYPQAIEPSGSLLSTGNWHDLLLDVYIDSPIRALVVPARSGVILVSRSR